MAWHWRRDGDVPFELLTRVGDDRPGGVPRVPRPARDPAHAGARRARAVVVDRHRHPARPPAVHGPLRRGRVGGLRAVAGRGASACARPGACTSSSSRARSASSSGARPTGRSAASRSRADFLGFRHYTRRALRRHDARRRRRVRRLAGAPGRRRRPGRSATSRTDLGRLVVVTFGAQGVWAFDGRTAGEDAFVPVDRRCRWPGTTVGCGDAFIAGFLRAWRDAARRAPRRSKRARSVGAEATAWRRPLPDEAYGDEARDALARADAASGRR